MQDYNFMRLIGTDRKQKSHLLNLAVIWLAEIPYNDRQVHQFTFSCINLIYVFAKSHHFVWLCVRNLKRAEPAQMVSGSAF